MPRLSASLACATALLLTFCVGVRGDKSFHIQGQEICLALTSSALASSAFDCIMGQYTEYATKTLSGCSVAMLNPDKAATSDIYRCACSFQPVQISCLRPACTGDQLQRLTSALSSTWCKDTGGAPTTPTGEAASTPAATGVGATPPGGGGNPSPTNTAEAAGGGGGSGPGQATSTTSRALARETAVPVVGVALAALAGLVADAL